MLKILILLSKLDSDGITNSTLLYIENMDRVDMDIHIGVASEYKSNSKAQIERIESLKVPIHYFPSRSKVTIQYCQALQKYLKSNKIDIVHVMGNSATMAVETLIAKKNKVPIRIVHCHNTQCKYKICNFLLKPILFSTATDLFACGTDAGKFLYNNRKFTVIPNGRKINRFLFNSNNREKIRKEMNVGNKKIIGSVGMFTIQKNHIFLIDVFAKLSEMSNDYELWMIGDGGEKKEEVYKKVKAYGLLEKVKFLGFRTDVEKILSAIDIMVLPSLYEGLPNVVIEWQIAQLPCLLSDTITRECKVMDNVKYISLNNDISKWAEEIMNIQVISRDGNQKKILEKMSSAGYNIEENAFRLREIYFDCIKRKSMK